MCDLDMMKRLAMLSGFKLSDGELARFSDDMSQILTLMDEIKAFSGEMTDNCAGALSLRSDEVTCPLKESLGGEK